jgi:predicted Zn-dependent protease
MTERIGGATRARAFASPTAYEAWMRAELAVLRRDPAEALRQLDLAVTADPSDPYLVVRQVEVTLLAGDVDDALERADALTHDHTDLAAGWIALARVHTRRNDPAAALAAVQRAVALDPNDPDTRAAAAEIGGGAPEVIAHARGSAPDARASDHVLAARGVARDPRMVSPAGRRAVGLDHVARGAWREADRVLSPLVENAPDRVFDRVRLIEARALDGRPGDAARLVPGVRVTRGAGTTESDRTTAAVAPSERARLWLVAGRVETALEEARAVLREHPDDRVARRVLGHALLLQGDFTRGARTLASVTPDAPGEAMIARVHDAFEGTLVPGDGDVPGEGHGAPGVAWALARIAIAEALVEAGRAPIADRVLAQALHTLGEPGMRGSRDRVRVARADLHLRRGDANAAREALADVETAWGQHRRGAMLLTGAPTEGALADLQSRTGESHEDALADAWITLACDTAPRGCPGVDLAARESSAREWAPAAPVTLRARALRASDPREASDLLRQADARDPTSPWTERVQRRRDGEARAQAR